MLPRAGVAERAQTVPTVLVIALAALALRLAFIALFDTSTSNGDVPYYLMLAESLRAGEGYREDQLLAYRPPGWPLVMAAIQTVFGESVTALRIAQAFIGSLFCVLMFFLGTAMAGYRAGVLAAGVSVVYPPMVLYSTELLSEMLFLLLLMAAVYALLRARDEAGLGWLVAAGAGFGLAILTREAGAVVLLATLLWQLADPQGPATGLRKWVAVFLVAALVVAPWTARNYAHFNELVPVSTNGGINFYMGNRAGASGQFEWALPEGARWNVAAPDGAHELEASRLGYAAGIEQIKADPGGFAALSAKRLWLMLQPPYHSISLSLSPPELVYRLASLWGYLALMVLGLFVAPLLWRTRYRDPAMLCYLGLLAVIAPHVITVAGQRYQFPVTPFLILLSVLVVVRALDGRREVNSAMPAAERGLQVAAARVGNR